MRHYHHEIPGPFAIILQILSGAVVGLLIAGAYLALKPVKVVDAKAAAEAAKAGPVPGERNVVLYTPGNPGHPSGVQWKTRESAFLAKAPTGVAASEQDVNRWFATTYGSAERRYEYKDIDFSVDTGLPVCRISGSDLQLGVEFRCMLGKDEKSVVAQAHGFFEKQGDQQVFVPTKVYLGSCPLPGPLGAMLVDRLGAAYPVPDAVAASWKSVTNAKVEEGQLKLSFN